jgi:alcohol dehydrogenase class IV
LDGFRWEDGERLIRFGRGALADAPELLGEDCTLLTTDRASEGAPGVVARAARVYRVNAGPVDELAAMLLDLVDRDPAGAPLAALGGGRVIDVAKALAAARPPRAVVAIPTTLSAAEMTRVHRHATGMDPATPRVRPAVVLNDPALSASQPEDELAASAANALAHALEGPLTTRWSPVPELAAHEAARLLATAWDGGEPDRDALALGALLSGYAIDGMGYGLHHVLSQTLVRVAGVGHGQANAAMLPHTLVALRRRAPERLGALDAAMGARAEDVAASLAERSGTVPLRTLGVTEETLDAAARAASQRPELAFTPPGADDAELRELYAHAF